MKKPNEVLEKVQGRLDDIRGLLAQMDSEAADMLLRRIAEAPAVFVTGKGRSGLVAQCFAMRLMQMGLEVHVPGEATCPRISEGDLMVTLSCSGTTKTTVELARISRDSGAHVVAVTAEEDSPLAEISHDLLLVPVHGSQFPQRETTVLGPYNNTLFEEAMFLYFDALVYTLIDRENIPQDRLSERHTNLE